VRTNREWTDEDYAAVFQKLGDQRAWFCSLKFEVRDHHVAVGRIWRNSSFSCEESFGLFEETVLRGITLAVARSRGFFENRGRMCSPTGSSRPIRIAYDQNVFSDKRQNHRLVGVLRRLPESGLSVIHPNPYLHACLLDYADGSTYDIWVATPTSILIIPKRKATTESIERVCNHICEEFEEGEVEEFAGK
jgi:hypothetical protein